MYRDVEKLCVGPDASIREAIAQIDATRHGIALVVDKDRRLLGTITDGDVRRAILARIDLGQPVSLLLSRKANTSYARPVTAPVGQDRNTYVGILKQHSILHLPLVDHEERVVGLVTLDGFVPDVTMSIQAVIMAGGQGSRLHPLTVDTPKPMLPVHDRPLMEIMIERLRNAGIREVKVTTHHKPEKIEKHFGDGKDFGVALSYVAEDRPLGTVGGLGLLEVPDDTTLVINGDILTQVNFRAMLAFHREHQADLTVAVSHYDLKVPYGVVECDGATVRRVSEKPVMGFFVNAGIYLLEPIVYRFIPNGQPFDMTDLIQLLIRDGRSVASFPVREYWLDIGDHAEYEQAEQDIRTGKVLL
jgi:dTDP-glucose pyrophosphorylase